MNTPNIIFLMDDQRRWDGLGIHRNEILTPNLDTLAQNGTCFEEAVCQCPMCIPSRNSIMYGRYPSQLGIRTNSYGINREGLPGQIALPERLRQAGYLTAGFGKTHWSHGWENPSPSTRGFDVRWIGQADDEEAYESGATMMGSHSPDALRAYDQEIQGFGPGEENPAGYLGCKSKIPLSEHRDGWICDRAEEWLRNYTPQPAGKPLFFYLSFMKPHAGYNIPAGYEEQYDVNRIPDLPTPPWPIDLPPTSHINPTREAGFLLNRTKEMQNTWEKLTLNERRQSTLRYFANMTMIDDLFGRALKALEEQGILENAIIIYSSDHGEMMGERHHRFSKYCLYESSVRVPLILSGSALPQSMRGKRDHRPVELVDILPTACSVAECPPDPSLPGVNLLAPFSRRGSYSELHGSGRESPSIAPALMWRNHDWKLILYLDGTLPATAEEGQLATSGELYSLKDDPNEWKNLFDHAEHTEVRERMTRELLMHLAVSNARYPSWSPDASQNSYY